MSTSPPVTVTVVIYQLSMKLALAGSGSAHTNRAKSWLGGGEGPTVDATSTRAQWVTSYKPGQRPAEGVEQGPTVDASSTRAQWVTSYGPPPKGKQVVHDHWVRLLLFLNGHR